MVMASSGGGALQGAIPTSTSFTQLLASRSLPFCSSSVLNCRTWVPCRGWNGTTQLVKISHSSPKRRLFISRAVASVETQQGSTPAKEEIKDIGQSRPLWKASIDFKWIRDNKEAVALNARNRKSAANVELVVELYERLCNLQTEVESLRAERNVVANRMKRKLDPSEREKLIAEGKHLKDNLVTLEEDLTQLTDKLQREAQSIPNSTHPDVPIGGEDAASLRKMFGTKCEFDFPVKDHVDLGQELDLFDFDAAAEVSGTKFYYLKNEAVLLEMGLINWALSELVTRGYTPLSTPDIVRSSVLEKCGFQPRALNTQVYSIEGTDQCLAGTAEIPVGGMYMDQIIDDSLLPLKFVAFSHCFRTEAGAAGYATRGLYRVHQFSKIEMFVICRPEDSDLFHEELISIEEALFSSLGLHFKTLDMPSEDLGAPAYRKYDVEAWMPGLGRYGEISSSSNCTDYQSRRLNIRYRPALEESNPSTVDKPKKRKGQLKFVHTLNATACAVPRMIISILENFQQKDGSIIIPEVLQPFMGGVKVISPKSK